MILIMASSQKNPQKPFRNGCRNPRNPHASLTAGFTALTFSLNPISSRYTKYGPLSVFATSFDSALLTGWGGLTLAGCQVPTKAALSFPSSAGQGREKQNKRLVGRDEDSERSLSNYRHGQNRPNFGELV